MGIVLGPNRYGKAETRVVRIVRDTPRHEIRDLNVSTSLYGDFAAAHTDGDQSQVLPTDTQKNTAFAYAKKVGVHSPEDYAVALGTRLLEATPAAQGAIVLVKEYAWDRVEVDGRGHDHAFVRRGGEVRTVKVGVKRGSVDVFAGLEDLVVLKSTGSEFKGFLRDEYTTLPDADDRILATALQAEWSYRQGLDLDFDATYDAVRALLLSTFATTYSRALQETLYAMGRAVLEAHDEIDLISFKAPNKHHFLVDLEPFGLDNPGEVFIAADRPYGLIEAMVTREPEGGTLLFGLPAFEAMPADEAGELLRTFLDVPRWADDVLAGRPYADTGELEAAMVAASATMTDDELEQALARHPRIGERADAAKHDAEHSTREQSGVDRGDADVVRRLEEGNRAYEERFGRVFIIRAAGRDAEEILAELRRRLTNPDDAERAETIDQLTQIAVLRMKEAMG
ncbi:urate oxidase [Nocardioides sp. BE266]|uniref:factor-independent urate hydroxylase n=1 Tax=Nocardioides sp. BE266 TaxID=2817725 RepID=UPI0028623B3A|nr:urate oxidase [Nocardioides sp. BE266]MDR7251667.1 urate oxidase [Nocardioides sp. BE266]